jgi:predicted dinucleotide-binding enzyme
VRAVSDARNSDYDPKSDGRIPELDNHVTTASELVARHFAGAHVVKALNAIPENEIERDARPSGAPDRRARPIAGDADHAKAVVVDLLDLLGFDAMDAGPLRAGASSQGGRPTASYCAAVTR